jgi:hypothetical protein
VRLACSGAYGISFLLAGYPHRLFLALDANAHGLASAKNEPPSDLVAR